MSKFSLVLLSVLILLLGYLACGGDNVEKDLTGFIEKKVAQLQPVEKERNLAYWKAARSGQPADFEEFSRLDLVLKKLFVDSVEFAQLKQYKDSGKVKAPLLARQLEKLHDLYLGNQLDTTLLREITNLASQVENKFSAFRGKIDWKMVTGNQILEILKNETNLKTRQKAWEASKMVGAVVADDLLKLVRLRNQAAQKLGYQNYYVMALELAEQNETELFQIFDDLAQFSETPFRHLKSELDSILARKLGIAPTQLKPWCYHDPFFQEAPMVFEIDLDRYYANQDVKVLTEKFFQGIGLPVDSILAQSDLFERDGKNPHAFSTNIDRQGDVRVLMNLKNDVAWMETSLHELGHGVYDYYLDYNLPYILREPAHAFTTEAIAMFFGRLARNPYWMQAMLNLTPEETEKIATQVQKTLRFQQLIFARWCQVMCRFERALYADPNQNLNRLWWDLVEKYQFVSRPAGRDLPDWAAKIHFSMSPVYYHNYMLGELMASQLHAYILKNIYQRGNAVGISHVNQTAVGQYLKQQIFQVGARYQWNEMLKQATGEPLNPKHFVEQFVN